jgi:hypothetical protein
MKKVFRFNLTKGRLLKLKLKAIRCNVWFRALSRIDRALIDSVIKVVNEVRSFTLAKILLSVVEKLEGALENRFLNALKEIGFPLARKLSVLAQKWGNDYAQNWAFDESFVKFLAIMHMNESRLWTAT